MPALVRWGRNHSAEPGTAGRLVIIGIQVDAAPRAGDNEPAAPVALETAVYFIGAEALANVAKHARAAHVDVRIRSQSDLVIVLIADDGVGGGDPGRDPASRAPPTGPGRSAAGPCPAARRARGARGGGWLRRSRLGPRWRIAVAPGDEVLRGLSAGLCPFPPPGLDDRGGWPAALP